MAKRTGRKTTGRLYPRGGWWWADWQAHGVKYRRSTGFRVLKGEEGRESKRQAQAWLDEMVAPFRAETAAGTAAELVSRAAELREDAEEVRAKSRLAEEEAEAARIPLAEAWDRHPYVLTQGCRGRPAGEKCSPQNIRMNQCSWQKFVDWAVEHHRDAGKKEGRKDERIAMQDVTPEMAREYADWLEAQGLTPSRRNCLVLVAGVMYRLAGLPSPFAGIPRARKQTPESREPFTPEQVDRMLSAASGEWKGFLAVLYFSGLRAADGATLTHRNRIIEGGVRKIRVDTGKTGRRVVLLEAPELTSILDLVVDRNPVNRSAPLFPEIAETYRSKGTQALSKRFKEFMAVTLGEDVLGEDGEVTHVDFEANEAREGGVRRVSRYGLHSWRHTLAAAAAAKGVPLTTVQAVLGHSSPMMTAVYATHQNAEAQSRLLEAISLDGHAVKALPGAAEAKALPAVGEELGRLLRSMTAENWSEQRDAALALLAKAAERP